MAREKFRVVGSKTYDEVIADKNAAYPTFFTKAKMIVPNDKPVLFFNGQEFHNIGKFATGNQSYILNDYNDNIASGQYSISAGRHTSALSDAEFACGKYNLSSTDKTTIFSVGNGLANKKSNAFEINNEGKIFIPGLQVTDYHDGLHTISYDGTNYDTAKSKGGSLQEVVNSLASKRWVIGTMSAKLSDAPTDGKVYGRQSGKWAVVASGGTVIQGVGKPGNAPHSEVFNDGDPLSAQGAFCQVTGEGCQANGSHARAGGLNSVAQASVSLAHGDNCVSSNASEVVVGKFNKNNTNQLFAIGCGADNNNRANAVSYNVNGECFLKGVGNYTGKEDLSTVTSIQKVINHNISNVNGNKKLTLNIADFNYFIVNVKSATLTLTISPKPYHGQAITLFLINTTGSGSTVDCTGKFLIAGQTAASNLHITLNTGNLFVPDKMSKLYSLVYDSTSATWYEC